MASQQASKSEPTSKQPAKVTPRPAEAQNLAADSAALERARADPLAASPSDILALQKQFGNRAIQRLIQTQLTVGPVGDPYEQEADRVAEQVASMAAPTTTPPVQRETKDEEEETLQMTPLAQQQEAEDEELHLKPLVQQASVDGGFEASDDLESRLAARRGAGGPLPGDVRSQMESSFRADFGHVRVHTDREAAQLNQELSAQAFTHGGDIYFGEGRYSPGSSEGKRLLAHELTHVVQQTGGLVSEETAQTKPMVSSPEDKYERESDTVAETVGEAARVVSPLRPSGTTGGDGSTTTTTEATVSEEPVEAPEGIGVSGPPTAATGAPPPPGANGSGETPPGEGRTTGIETAFAAPTLAPLGTNGTGTEKGKNGARPTKPEGETGAEAEVDATSTGAGGPAAMEVEVEVTPAATTPTTTEAAVTTTTTTAPTTETTPTTTEAAPPTATTPTTTEAAVTTTTTTAPTTETTPTTTEATAPGTETPSAPTGAAATGEKPPASPEDDPAFKAVKARTKGAATREKSHEAPAAAAGAAQAAAKGPANEVSSLAEAGQVGEMEQQQPKPFDRAAFKAALLEKIAAAAPQTLEEADKFKEENKLDDVKGDLTTKVAENKDKAEGNIEAKTEEAPDTSGITPKEVTPLPPTDPGATPEVPAAGAAPKPKAEGEVSTPFNENSQKLDQQMANANVSEEQLAKSNEPEFKSALDSKKEAQADAAAAPQAYRHEEQTTLTGARREANATAHADLQEMHGGRAALLTQVAGHQAETRTQDEQKRAEVSTHIEGIYNQTKQKVEERLSRLDTEVNQAFDNGAADAEHAFEEYVDRRMDAYKDERYSGVDGAILWAADKLLGMPDEVNTFYQEGKDLYLRKMDGVLDNVAATVETGLTEAKALITEGKQEIQTYITGLPVELQEVGNEAAKNIESKFDELEQSVKDKQNELINSLAQKYNENVQKLDSRIEELKAANRGLVDAAFDAIKGVIETIIKLKNMLLETLARAANAIDLVIQDPIGFLGNLIDGIKLGLDNFMANIGEHLKQGLLGWLFGALAEAGIQLPQTFDIKGILSLVLQVLGLTYANIRARAVAILGEKIVAALETAAEIFKILVTEGPAGLWEWIKDKIGNFKDMIIEEIKQFVMERIIVAGITWLIGLLNPASAFIKACKAIYDIIMFFVERGSQIMALVNAVIDSVTAIAQGNISVAAKFVEDALAKAIPVVIGFLASLLGLGGISEKIKSVIEKIRAPINKAIDWVIKKAVGLVKAAGKLFGFGKDEKKEGADEHKGNPEVQAGLAALHGEEESLAGNGGISRSEAETIARDVKQKHPVFQSITVVDGGGSWSYDYVVRRAVEPGAKPKEAGQEDLLKRAKDFKNRVYKLADESGHFENPELAQIAVQSEEIERDLATGTKDAAVLKKHDSDLKRLEEKVNRLHPHPSKYVVGDMLGGRLKDPSDPRSRFYKGSYRGTAWTTVTQRAKTEQKDAAGNYLYQCQNTGPVLGPKHKPLITESEITMEHKMNVAEHWNLFGHNMTHEQRNEWYDNPDNLIVLCGSCNYAQPKLRYKPEVGPDFRGPGEE